jgi:hypothetical protein
VEHERETQKYDDGGKERTRYVDEWSISDAYESFAQCKKEALSGLNDIARAMKGSVVPKNSGAIIIFSVQLSKEDTKKTEESDRDLGIRPSPYGRLVSRSGRFESICLPSWHRSATAC